MSVKYLHKCAQNTAIAELTTRSDIPPTDSTNIQVTMQHTSGTALICDIIKNPDNKCL